MSADEVIMRMLGTGSSYREREMARAATLFLFWLLDESPAQWVHDGSLTREGATQALAWRRHAEGKR